MFNTLPFEQDDTKLKNSVQVGKRVHYEPIAVTSELKVPEVETLLHGHISPIRST